MKSTNRKPKIFIGSSKESLPVVRTLETALADIADVVPWTDQDSFREPGHFFLDSLIEAAYKFDIAVLVFGKDDTVISRKAQRPAPRDNVIFELGLFMSVMDRRRTIIVTPRVWRTKLKVLSDLQGLNFSEYDPPRKHTELPNALRKVIEYVRRQVRVLQVRPQVRGPSSVAVVWRHIEEQLSTVSSTSQQIQNIALDMEVTWRSLHDEILANPDRHNVQCQVLFIDHKSSQLRQMGSATVSLTTAKKREQEIRTFLRKTTSLKSLKSRKIDFACRVYSDVPVIHGFLLNRKQLFVSLCDIDPRGRLVGSPNPYLFVEKPTAHKKDIGAEHLIGVFQNWFGHLWKSGRRIWPE